ncbi:MAG TPA: ATPase [Ruminococcaceae bacterium]|nr:ATPase [Oscillospiraceae bacterium]
MEQKKPRTTAKSAAKTAPKKTAPRRTKKQQGDVIFALDIGTRTVVGVLAEKTQDGYKLIDMETQAHESRSMTDGQIEDIDAVAAVVKSVKAALERRQLIKLQRVCVAAAGRALRTLRHSCAHDVSSKRVISAADIREAELEAVRSAEEAFTEENSTTSFYCVGHSVISLELDGYKVSKPEGHRGNSLVTEVIAAFLPAYVVESLCAAVDLAGLETAGLTLEPIAAINAVVPKELRLINIVMCDIGAGTSDVAASRDGSITAYGMATIAGDEMTEALMKQLLVDFNEAERIKTSPDPQTEYTDILFTHHTITAEQVAELIRPAEEELAHTICEEILAANGGAPQAVFLVGGGSKLPGLPELVADGLGLPAQRVAVGSREMIRGITAPKSVELGTEHATPVGIAITASEGVKYDFTTITLNGRKIRALDTRRLTVFELCSLAGIKPEQLLARSGKSLSYTADGERIVLRGTHSTPCEISLNGKECSLNSQVRKGDEVNVVPAVPGEDAAALLSDQYDMAGMSLLTVTLDGRQITTGDHILVNGTPTAQDADIENGAVLRRIRLDTLGALLAQEELPAEGARVNGESQPPEYTLRDGDVITSAPEGSPVEVSPEPEETPTEPPAQESAEDGVPIVFNGMPAVFPMEPGRQPVFLDILAAFSDNPTGLLAGSSTVMINGKLARLDEVIHPGDEIVIE